MSLKLNIYFGLCLQKYFPYNPQETCPTLNFCFMPFGFVVKVLIFHHILNVQWNLSSVFDLFLSDAVEPGLGAEWPEILIVLVASLDLQCLK